MKKMDTITFTFIAALVIALFQMGIAYRQFKDKKNAEKEKMIATEKARRAEEETKKYRLKFEEALETNLKLAEENKALSIENNRLNNETLKNITGYDSFPVIVIDGYLTNAFKNPKINEEIIEFYRINFHLINTGKYPLNNISIRFADSYGKYIGSYVTVTKNGIAQEPDKKFEKFDQNQKINIESLPKNHTDREFYTTTLPKELNARFTVEITWSGGNITYDIEVNPTKESRERFTKTKYEQIYSNSLDINKELISEKIKQEFPHLKFTLD
ncbi:hypothetical protein V1389_13650 [Flavobacterium rakeshii]|uniref:hypothetical protein n=1 Tax=Flavobacterium rakeshii TaxID=1038845 RepID=UPI002E7B944D|nr:hypothetical protein [Flavobacterium rakeshii]MEE1899388.1 hypothetical protein [Flavobacterium rakeshii]